MKKFPTPFEKIKFDLSKYASQTITYPKIQEAPSRDLFNFIYYTYKKEVNKFYTPYFFNRKRHQ